MKYLKKYEDAMIDYKYNVGDILLCIKDYGHTDNWLVHQDNTYVIADIFTEYPTNYPYLIYDNENIRKYLSDKEIDTHFELRNEKDPEVTIENKHNKMKYIKLFEDTETPISGKEGFLLYLSLADQFDNMFTRSDYLNTEEYSYFFVSDKIKKPVELLDELEMKRSLQSVYNTLKSLQDNNISFYFGIKKSTLEYGFYSNSKFKVYKAGSFITNNAFLRKLDNESLMVVKKYLNKSHLKLIQLLSTIKVDFPKIFHDVNCEIKILDELRIRNRYKVDAFNKEDLDQIKFLNTLEAFKEKFSWGKKVDAYVDISDEYISLYFKIKQKILKIYELDEIA